MANRFEWLRDLGGSNALIEIFLDEYERKILFSKAAEASLAFKYDRFSASQLAVRWPETETHRQLELRKMLASFDYIPFTHLTRDGRQALWKGVRFYYNLSSVEFPYPEKLADIDDPYSDEIPPSDFDAGPEVLPVSKDDKGPESRQQDERKWQLLRRERVLAIAGAVMLAFMMLMLLTSRPRAPVFAAVPAPIPMPSGNQVLSLRPMPMIEQPQYEGVFIPPGNKRPVGPCRVIQQ